MLGFLYYIPGQISIDRKEISALGLDYAFAGSGCNINGLSAASGPDGTQGGCVFSPEVTVPSGQAGYETQKGQQIWRQIPGSKVWVGMSKSERPTPEVLARQEMVTGYLLQLDDGQAWVCPTARSLRIVGEDNPQAELALRWSCRLPRRLDLAADGTWIAGGVVAKFAALWELAEQYAASRYGGDQAASDRLSGNNAVDAAVLCLQTNYRVGRTELALLGALHEDLPGDILDRLIDNPTMVEFLKKKLARSATSPLSAGSSSSDGPAVGIPTTPPPGPTPGPLPPDSPTPNPSTSTSSS